MFRHGIWEFRKTKTRNKSSDIILLVMMLSLIAVVPVQPVDAIYISYAWTTTQIIQVPFFVLYDPPSAESYAKITQARTQSGGISFGGGFAGSSVSGGFTGSFTVSTSYQSPDDEQMNCVICNEYELRFDVYYYETSRRSWYRAILVGATGTGGKAIIRFDSLSSYGLVVNDLTGQTGDYQYHRTVNRNTAMDDHLEYYWSDFYNVEIGFQFSSNGVTFGAGVSFKSADSTKLEAIYHYKDPVQDLDFYLNSNYDIDFTAQEPNYVDSINIWFSE